MMWPGKGTLCSSLLEGHGGFPVPLPPWFLKWRTPLDWIWFWRGRFSSAVLGSIAMKCLSSAWALAQEKNLFRTLMMKCGEFSPHFTDKCWPMPWAASGDQSGLQHSMPLGLDILGAHTFLVPQSCASNHWVLCVQLREECVCVCMCVYS